MFHAAGACDSADFGFHPLIFLRRFNAQLSESVSDFLHFRFNAGRFFQGDCLRPVQIAVPRRQFKFKSSQLISRSSAKSALSNGTARDLSMATGPAPPSRWPTTRRGRFQTLHPRLRAGRRHGSGAGRADGGQKSLDAVLRHPQTVIGERAWLDKVHVDIPCARSTNCNAKSIWPGIRTGWKPARIWLESGTSWLMF